MGISGVIASILICTIFHFQQASSQPRTLDTTPSQGLRCFSCYGYGCKEPKDVVDCPPFTDIKCYAVAVSESDNTPDRMGCTRNCNAITGFQQTNLCSLCETNLCNQNVLKQRGNGNGNEQKHIGMKEAGIGSGAGVDGDNQGEPKNASQTSTSILVFFMLLVIAALF